MSDSKMVLAQALLLMEQFVHRQIKSLPPPPLDRSSYHLPSIIIIIGKRRKHRLIIQTELQPTHSARSEYFKLLDDIRRKLDAASDPV